MNPRLSHILNLLKKSSYNKNYEDIRILYEGVEDKAYIYGINKKGNSINIGNISLSSFALILGTLLFKDPLRFEAGISSVNDRSVLIDIKMGNLLSVSLDFPSDNAYLSYETGPVNKNFGDNQSELIRSGFELIDTKFISFIENLFKF